MSENSEKLARTKLEQVQDHFVLEWGRMSSSWGINRTMAQIHALLFITGEALTVDEIMDQLHISRGNASMNLRDLIDWGIVRRFRRPGERKDTYASDQSAWQMFARIVRERKRREIDPTVGSIKECLSKLDPADDSRQGGHCRDRLNELLEIFELIDTIYQQAISTDTVFESALRDFRSTGQPNFHASR